jgi:dTDP-4-amino-4,6-dideoxygalactose transaminase
VPKVDFFSFKNAPESLKNQWKVATQEVIESGQFIGGRYVSKFENEWASYLGVNHAIGVGNGYDALVVALKILGVKTGDLVAVPSHTFIATWLAVEAVGATPVGIDCDDRGLMDLDLLESQSLRFAAVIPVHMHGQMVDMPRLATWAKIKDIKVVEDCAQAHGAKISGKLAGTWGDFGAFSFYPTKNLGALGDGGALVTHDGFLAAAARSYINYGSLPGNKYEYQFNGINSRLDPIQAAILSVNLSNLDVWNARRKEIAAIYFEKFQTFGVKSLQTLEHCVFHHYIIESDARDESRGLLEKSGIKTEIHYPESAETSFGKFNRNFIAGEQIKASRIASRTLSLPMSPWMSSEDIDQVIEAVGKI